jgi:DNA primase
MTPSHTAAPGPAREDEPQQKLAALRTRLHADAQALRTPGDWAALLRTTALMPEQDFANTLLVSTQLPGAVMVRDYERWAHVGRQVRRGEKGIETFAVPPRPAPRRPQDDHEPGDDQPLPTWRDATRTAYVWDVSQTTGPPATVPAGPPTPGPALAGVWDALCWLARRQGFAVEQEHGAPADGTVFWTARRIRVLPALSAQEAVWALAHQLGHVLLHDQPGGHAPGTTTTGCIGLRKAEADSVAYVTCARYGVTAAGQLAYPESWAGRDPRAQPAAAVLSAGHRITTAAAGVIRHTDRILRGDDPAPAVPALAPRSTTAARPRPAPPAAPAAPGRAPSRLAVEPTDPDQPTGPGRAPDPGPPHVLDVARDFYAGQLASSWAPEYLDSRGIGGTAVAEWEIGYAPAKWTALTSHLRGQGYGDDEIKAAGLAKVSSRGTLIDLFRDRVMLPVRNEHGEIAGFIGRLHPARESPDVGKYLNSPASALYKKGSLLFGLHQGRAALARGAMPVIVEGPFDALTVTLADPARHVGLAPCGTALTTEQAELLSRTTGLPHTGVLVAFDADTAGRKAAVRAYGLLRPHTPKLQAARLNAKDPAAILAQDGPAALRAVLREHREPLSARLIDARIGQFEQHLDHIEDRYRAMHSTAALIAELLPAQAAKRITQLTGGRQLVLVDDLANPVEIPQLPRIAAALPAETAYQVVRAAVKLGFDATEVMTEVANSVTRDARSPKGRTLARHGTRERGRPVPGPEPARLAEASFPLHPLTPPNAAGPAVTSRVPRPQASTPWRSARR